MRINVVAYAASSALNACGSGKIGISRSDNNITILVAREFLLDNVMYQIIIYNYKLNSKCSVQRLLHVLHNSSLVIASAVCNCNFLSHPRSDTKNYDTYFIWKASNYTLLRAPH